MPNPTNMPGVLGGDTLLGLSCGLADCAAAVTGLPPEVSPVPGLPAVWLAPNACLMQSHQPALEGEPVVIQVVGVADCGNWLGAVLMLD